MTEQTLADLAIVLSYRSVEICRNEGSNNWIRLYPVDGKPWQTFSGLVFANVVAAARKWIEEQKP
jgi:hypothetical protein